jgi:hypothetical protein
MLKIEDILNEIKEDKHHNLSTTSFKFKTDVWNFFQGFNDKTAVEVAVGTHFAVKAAAYHNYVLHNNTQYETKYSYINSGDKVKYYYCKGEFGLEVFAYKRGSFPIEIAPAIDYDESFFRFVLSPINTIVNTLGLPEISKRLTILFDLFNGI